MEQEKDIVERLREYYDPNELLDEAADEIERLRVICEHWEVKYARMKYDYLEMVQTGKLPEFVTTEMGRSVLNDREKGETLGQERDSRSGYNFQVDDTTDIIGEK